MTATMDPELFKSTAIGLLFQKRLTEGKRQHTVNYYLDNLSILLKNKELGNYPKAWYENEIAAVKHILTMIS